MYQSIEEGAQVYDDKKRGWGRPASYLALSLVVVLTIVGIFATTTSFTTPLTVLPMQKTKDVWTLYKVTSSIKSGTYAETGKFMSKYISYTWGEWLGLNHTVKVVGDTLGIQIHFVDTDIFHDLDSRTVNDWSDLAEDYDPTTFETVFFHNKIQLYVPDLAAHLALLEKDSVTVMKRLSATPKSSTNNVAHLGIWMAGAMTMVELVGPSSSLSDADLAEFSEWEDLSCSASHTLPHSLEYYNSAYNAIVKTDKQVQWEAETGLYTPCGIMVSIPASSLDAVANTISLSSEVMQLSVETASYTADDGSTCQMSTFSVDDFTVHYVQNDSLMQSDISTLTVADWEADIALEHSQFISTASTTSSWDRYLDTHIGVYVDVSDSTSCESYYDFVEDAIASNAGGYQYALRVGGGSHYYTTTDGLRAWEYNVNDCTKDGGTHLCGAIDSNSVSEYKALYGADAAVSDCTGIMLDQSEFE